MKIFLTPNEIDLSIKALSRLLANSYLLALKTQNYHWNVKGILFSSLHDFFGKQYEELSEAIDEIAERIRMIGSYTKASFKEFLALTSLKEGEKVKSAEEMLKSLAEDHRIIIAEIREMLIGLDESHDEGSIDFLVGRIQAHEKMLWMLDSHLG